MTWNPSVHILDISVVMFLTIFRCCFMLLAAFYFLMVAEIFYFPKFFVVIILLLKILVYIILIILLFTLLEFLTHIHIKAHPFLVRIIWHDITPEYLHQ